MNEGSTKLNYAIKTLRRKWDEHSPTWMDAVRADFEAKHLNPLVTQVSATVRGMNQLDEIIQRMRRECSDQSDSLR